MSRHASASFVWVSVFFFITRSVSTYKYSTNTLEIYYRSTKQLVPLSKSKSLMTPLCPAIIVSFRRSAPNGEIRMIIKMRTNTIVDNGFIYCLYVRVNINKTLVTICFNKTICILCSSKRHSEDNSYFSNVT